VERYPAIEPYETGMLDVGDGHSVYWECCGNPDGIPAVYVHGGPGGSTSPGARRYFDPAAYRVVLFDQRGCGRSTPPADDPATDLTVNTTWHLVRDLELLRTHLGVDRWVMYGVSWGVTLSLVYAQAHPDRVRAMVLGAVTSGSRRETRWITQDMGRVFPVEWTEFAARVPAEQRDDLAAAYARLLADPASCEQAALAWCVWEDTHMSLMPDWQPFLQTREPAERAVFARLVTHYWSHGCFLADGHVMAGMPRLRGIPATLIHGRYDVSGPPDTALAIHRAWPGSTLHLLADAGHGGGSFPDRVREALDSYRT
jgi:proline iminopeptidase